MVYICSKQGKIDRLWGVFIKHILQMGEAGIKVEYVRKGEVILNGIRYEPVSNTLKDKIEQIKATVSKIDIKPASAPDAKNGGK